MRASPCVDALLRVSDHADIAAFAHEEIDEHVLNLVGVLIFVNEDIIELVLPMPPDIRISRQQIDGKIDEVIVIERIAPLHLRKVLVCHRRVCRLRVWQARYIINYAGAVTLFGLGYRTPSAVYKLWVHAGLGEDVPYQFAAVVL